MAKITLDVERLETKKVDNRGRVYLGRDYIGEELEIAIVNREEGTEDDKHE